MKVGMCYFCEVTTTLIRVEIDGKRYDACEQCMPNILRNMDLLKNKYQMERERQILNYQNEFVDEMIAKQLLGDYNE